MDSAICCYCFALAVATLVSFCSAGDTLTPTTPLADAANQTLVSSGGKFALGFFSPPDNPNRYVGIWYNTIPLQTVVWVANRAAPLAGATGVLSLAANGTLVIYDNSTSSALWFAAVPTLSAPEAQLLDSGNFVVRSAGSGGTAYAWQSFDYPTDVLLPGMKFGFNLTSGLNRAYFAWKSYSDPSPSPVHTQMDISGDPEVFVYNGATKIWRSGPWDGISFNGVPDITSYKNFSLRFINNADEITYSFEILNPNLVSHLVTNYTGHLQRLVWLEAAGAWSVYFYAPKDPCDNIYACGANSVCNSNASPMCSCLQGFVPRSPADWALLSWSGGCVRRTALDCTDGTTDGFLTVSHAKTPDTSNSTVLRELQSLEECQAACLSNCSCTAYAGFNITVGGGGCVIWTDAKLMDLRVYTDFGQDLFVRLASKDLPAVPGTQSQDKSSATVAIATSIVGAAAILAACAALIIWIRKRKARRQGAAQSTGLPYIRESLSKNSAPAAEDLELPLMDFFAVAAATDGFSVANKLGEGGFGPVYKGKLQTGVEIAVKRLAKNSVQGADEFKNEVKLIAKLQHRNLVRLISCCVHDGERMLIYEYMENRSLNTFLFDKARSSLLDWRTRYRIIDGVARGLLYLHQDSRQRIIHRDLKTSNILLDREMNPKISDFGMARIFGDDETEINTRKVVGTYGYMAPEYAMDGMFSVKSDVFSFGVVVLEILSGQRNRGMYVAPSQQNLLAQAWSLWSEGKAADLVDASMGGVFPEEEVIKCLQVGLLCVQDQPEERPSMASVVVMLSGSGNLKTLPSPNRPGFGAARVQMPAGMGMESSSSNADYSVLDNKADYSMLDDMSITIIEGR